MKIKFTPELRAEAAAAAAVKVAVTDARTTGAEYFRVLGRRGEVYEETTALARNPGQHDPIRIIAEWEKAVHQAEPMGERARVTAACEATHPVQIKIFNAARAQVDAAIKERVAPFFSVRTLGDLPFKTELEQKINGLAVRLRHGLASTLTDAVRHADLVQQFLADIAADRNVFTLEASEVAAA